MIIQHNGLELSSLPTQCHKQLIHVRINSLLKQNLLTFENLNPNFKHSFQQTPTKTHIKAYVDPSQLSYNSFENILNLDEYYFGPKVDQEKNLKLEISDVEPVQNYYRFCIKDPQNLLIELHKMNLYSLPFNNLSRGGKRMIFSSQILADFLKNELVSSIDECSQRFAYDNLCQDLHSVNHVFRLNCFSPSSGNFKTHYDTPFSDNNRKLYSKYTLLIYLTGGSNLENSCLRIENEKINEIPAMIGILFDQRYEHEGWPYVEGEKIFLRSELIYHIKNVDNDERVAEMFNKACYFHKQSLCNPQDILYASELQKYSNQLFNHTAKLRYSLGQKKHQLYLQRLKNKKINSQQYEKALLQIEPKYLLKKNLETVYATNGNSFWFRDAVPLNLIAKLVLVDYFNGKMGKLSEGQVKEAQKMKIKSKPLELNLFQKNIQNNPKMQLENQPPAINIKYTTTTQQQNKINQQILKLLNLFSFDDEEQSSEYPYAFQDIIGTENKEYNIKKWHCSLCDSDDRQTSQHYEQQAREISLKRLYNKMSGVSVVLFNGKLHIDNDCIQIDENKREILFNEAFLNHSINFASCQCETFSRRQVIAKQTVQVEGFLLPKITYEVLKPLKGYKLSIDMFKNGFIYRIKTSISRPYAVNPSDRSPQDSFYDRDDEYVDSDNDFDEYSRKRNPQSQSKDRFLYQVRQRRNRSMRNE